MSARRKTVRLLSVLSVSSVCVASSAHAYSDQDRFAEGAEKGGGGGRYFTGSPADSFGCSVCHRGGTAPKLEVRGLPENYVPGTTYDLELSWDSPALAHALTLEIATEQGLPGGTLTLPEGSLIGPSERCNGLATGEVASTLYMAGTRQVLSFQDCGASLVRVRWTAPQATEVTLAAAIVRSDASATPEGDGVTELSRSMLAEGVSRQTEGGCGVARSDGHSSFFDRFLALAALAFAFRRKKRI